MDNIFPYDSVELSSDQTFLIILDQTQLPAKEVFLYLNKEDEIIEAISKLKVRGAPAIGIAAAFGLCVVLKRENLSSINDFSNYLVELSWRFESSRPTAVNLSWSMNRMREKLHTSINCKGITVGKLLDLLFIEAILIKSEDIEMCRRISEYGLTLLKPNMGVLTHCNAGHFAVSRLGTALGPIYLASNSGYNIKVYADETRPLLQGARLTTYELMKAGVDVTLICDNMAASVMSKGWIDAVFVGCDRIANNGDVANKIGTSALAVLAKYWNIPFYVLGPSSSIYSTSTTGKEIVIEERPAYEVTDLWFKDRVAPIDVKVYNPSFDVTSAELISAIITEKGIFKFPYNFK